MKEKQAKIEQVATDALIPYAMNARTHSKEQVAQIAASIREFGFVNPVLIDAQSTIIAGHGRVLAAQKLDMPTVPCLRITHLTDIQRRAYIIADNKIALNSSWDIELLNIELDRLKEDEFDVGIIGFTLDEIISEETQNERKDAVTDGEEEKGEEKLSETYTHKIQSPVYTPTGAKPEVEKLYSTTKTEELRERINKAVGLPDSLKAFLLSAAERHTVFNFKNIAEYYCHAPKEHQRLFEESCLVLIDFKSAIEGGFVKMSNILSALADGKEISEEEHGDA